MEAQEKYTDGNLPVPANWEEVFTPFYFAANKGDAPVRKTLAPSFQTVLIFSLGKPATVHLPGRDVEISNSIAIGPLKHPLEYTLPPGGDMLAAGFFPDAFYRLFGRHLKGRGEYLQDPAALSLGHPYSSLRDTLLQTPGTAERAALIVNKTSDLLQTEGSAHPDPNAKECHRHRRFLRAVELLVQHGTPDWFEVIDQCGFYDQSHLVRDFNHYLGITPAEYLRLREDVCVAGA